MSNTREAAGRVFLPLFRGIARLALRAGLDCRQLTECLRLAFVDVARQDYGLRGRPTNNSRVAFKTGLTRKEVHRLRTRLAGKDIFGDIRNTNLQSIVNAWKTRRGFQDSSGRPRPIPVTGSPISLVELISKAMPVVTIRKELTDAGVANLQENGLLEFADESNVPAFSSIVHCVRDYLTPVVLAMVRQNEGDQNVAWPMSVVISKPLNSEDMETVRRISSGEFKRIESTYRNVFDALDSIEGPVTRGVRGHVVLVHVESQVEG